ncbi:hypothetical protein BH11ACT8_BH11ACT8_22370 [soil metagenome]
MNIVRRLVLTLVTVILLAAAGLGVAYGTDVAGFRDTADRLIGQDDPAPAAAPAVRHGRKPVDRSPGKPSAPPVSTPSDSPSPIESPKPAPEPSPEEPSSQAPEPKPDPEPQQAGPALIAAGDQGDDVRDLQARLRQIYWFQHDVTGLYGDVTTAAVEGFQAKREIPVTGEVDQTTLDRLYAMTTEPSAAELANEIGANVPGKLDARCTTGHVLCIDKTSRTLRWVVDGKVKRTVDVRFGAEYTPTREGVFSVQFKSRDHVSSLYGSSMPFAMFFSGGQAVHYSSDFAAYGYGHASHGCVNVRDYDAIAALFDEVNVGDPVIVYRS